jgi:hypothetical protein
MRTEREEGESIGQWGRALAINASDKETFNPHTPTITRTEAAVTG